MTSSPLGASAWRSSSARLRAQCNRFGVAIVDATPWTKQRGVVVAPRRAWQVEQPLALDEAALRLRIRIDEDLPVVEDRNELRHPAAQRAVAEHIARHVADSRHGEWLRLYVDAQIAEVVLHAFPGATRRDGLLFMVVPIAATRSERVGEPEPVLRGHLVCRVRQVRRAFIGGHDKVGIILIVSHDRRWVHHLSVDHVVRHVEQPGDEFAVSIDQIGIQCRTWRECSLENEPSLGSHRHDDRVLQHLGLHQPQDLGAEIVVPIAPPDAAARHTAAAQVNTFKESRVHVDLEQWPRRDHPVHAPALDLDR